MSKRRLTVIGGWTDYSVASLELIISDLEKHYFAFVVETRNTLEELKKQVIANFERLDDHEGIINYIEYCIILFQSFEYDLKRVLNELSKGVENRHVDIIKQIWERSCHDEYHTIEFKNEYIAKDMKDESMRPLLDDIYGKSRDQLVHNKNLGDLSRRLKTFVGSRSFKKEEIRLQEPKPLRITPIIPFPTPKGTSWFDVSIRFLSNETAELRAGSKSEGKNFAEMGFMDNRTKSPGKLWKVLILFGQRNGEISWETLGLPHDIQKNFKKHIQRLRYRLKQLFQIEDDPFEEYRRVKAYKTKFKIELLDKTIL